MDRHEIEEILSQELIDKNSLKQCLKDMRKMYNKVDLGLLIGLIDKQPIVEHRKFGRDDRGRCRLRGCNLCDSRKEQLHKTWIPCSTRLPESDGVFEVTIKSKNGKRYVEMCGFHKKARITPWGIKQWEHGNVIAWRQKPEPYREVCNG